MPETHLKDFINSCKGKSNPKYKSVKGKKQQALGYEY
jgi:hypothetical protein